MAGRIRRCTPEQATSKSVYVARPSPLGNPFKTRSKPENVAEYRQWLSEKLSDRSSAQATLLTSLVERVLAGESLSLVCHCRQPPCHADVIIEWLEAEVDRRLQKEEV